MLDAIWDAITRTKGDPGVAMAAEVEGAELL